MASTVSPHGAHRRVFKKEAYSVFELGDKRQREIVSRTLSIKLGCLPKIRFSFGMQV